MGDRRGRLWDDLVSDGELPGLLAARTEQPKRFRSRWLPKWVLTRP